MSRCLLFFFKQKTAYEMRISAWSSDVCSSDLALAAIMLVGILAVLLGMAGVAVRDSVGPLESASYVLVTAVGLWLFAAQLRRRPQAGHGHNHSHDHDGCGHHHLPDPVLLDRQARGDRKSTRLNSSH